METFTKLETLLGHLERRKGKDLLSASLTLFSVVTLIIVLTIILCLLEAKAQTPISVNQLTLPLHTLWILMGNSGSWSQVDGSQANVLWQSSQEIGKLEAW